MKTLRFLQCLSFEVAACLLASISQQTAIAADSSYIMVDLGTLGGPNSTANDINDSGQVIGNAELPGGSHRAFLWSGGTMINLGTLGGASSQASGINEAGHIVGGASRPGANIPVPFLYSNGSMVELPVSAVGAVAGIAYDINDSGTVVGIIQTSGGTGHAFSHAGTTMTDLGTFGGVTSAAFAINNAGQIAAAYRTTQTGPRRAVRYHNGAITPLGTLGGPEGQPFSINAAGHVVGFADIASGLDHAFLYTGGALMDLGTVTGTQSAALGIDDMGRIVGSFAPLAPPTRAFLYANGAAVDLNTITIGLQGWTLSEARMINAHGLIAATARGPSGFSRAVVLIPRAPATSRLVNLSVRAGLVADRPLIAGFATDGGGVSALLRGIGPGLTSLLEPGDTSAADTRLTLFDSASATVDQNDNWGGVPDLQAAADSVGAFPIPTDSLDALLLRQVSGPHSAHLSTTADGIGLFEFYQTDAAPDTRRLVNLSARYHIGSGADVLIAGFAIEGTGAKTMLIRSIGPGLAAHGVSEYISDCRVTVFNAEGVEVATNNDWAANLSEVFVAAGAFDLPVASKDSAFVVSLPPGAYTVILSGVDAATGEGLIELYDLDL